MSDADQHHRAEAIRLFGNSMDRAQTDADVLNRAVQGMVSALLAVEARLGELVEQQQTATMLAGSAYGLVTPDFVRDLLGRVHADVADRLGQADGRDS